MVLQEKIKTYSLGGVWDYFCESNGVLAREGWFDEVKKYEETGLKQMENKWQVK